MTEPTPEQIQRACDLARDNGSFFEVGDYALNGCFTALADTIAELDEQARAVMAVHAELFVATMENAAMQAERDKARADLEEIDALLEGQPPINSSLTDAQAIAAPYRVETDPVDDLINAIAKQMRDGPLDVIWHELLRAELAKRGLEIGRSA